MIKRLATGIFSAYAFLIFLIWMFALLPFFIVAFFLRFPFDGNLVISSSRWWARIFFFFTGIRYRFSSTKKLERDQPYIFVCNHISYLDIPMMLLATGNHSVRMLGKAEMGRIPVFGFIYKMGTVSVFRDDPMNRKQSVNELKELLEKNVSIFICPEGTFNMTHEPLKKFYDGAFRIAAEMKKPIVPILFPDTYDRMNYKSIFSLTPGKCRAIRLNPVTMKENESVEELKIRVREIMEEGLKKLNPSWVK